VKKDVGEEKLQRKEKEKEITLVAGRGEAGTLANRTPKRVRLQGILRRGVWGEEKYLKVHMPQRGIRGNGDERAQIRRKDINKDTRLERYRHYDKDQMRPN